MPRSVLDHTYGRSPTLDRVAGAVGDFGGRLLEADTSRRALAWDWDTEARRRRGGDLDCRVVVSPGAVQLTYGRVRGWERDRFDSLELAKLEGRLRRAFAKLDKLDLRLAGDAERWTGEWDYFAERETVCDEIDGLREALGLTVKRGRARCGEWSRKSRARMTRRLATLDWSGFTVRSLPTPAFGIVECAPAMLTLTYPGDYQAVAPSGEISKRQLQAFRKWWERQMGPSQAVWKLERQRRGAPHYHLLVMVPMAHDPALQLLRSSARLAWAKIVAAKGVERIKHERAGVSIDLAEGARYSDPQRIAVYFSKHNSSAVESPKAYQNVAPDGWLDPEDGGGVGRWWGYWRMTVQEIEGSIAPCDAVAVQRLLRGWVRSQRRTRRLKVRRVWRKSGVIRQRAVTRRYAVRALSGCRPSGFVLSNDAPTLARAIARSLTEPGDWPRGERRPLP